MFGLKTAKDRRIEDLERRNEELRKIVDEHREAKCKYKQELDETKTALAEEQAKTRFSVFANENGLMPCESLACKLCNKAVWHEGRIAGCSKGIQCESFKPKEQVAPVVTNTDIQLANAARLAMYLDTAQTGCWTVHNSYPTNLSQLLRY